MSNSTTVTVKFRKAVRVAEETALRAGELHNSLTDELEVTPADVHELGFALNSVNSKRKSLVDASTAVFFFNAAGHFGKAADALRQGDQATAAEELDLGALELDKVEDHVVGLFRR